MFPGHMTGCGDNAMLVRGWPDMKDISKMMMKRGTGRPAGLPYRIWHADQGFGHEAEMIRGTRMFPYGWYNPMRR
jgi:hypothetical protein